MTIQKYKIIAQYKIIQPFLKFIFEFCTVILHFEISILHYRRSALIATPSKIALV
jgi:hypothetical protein